MKGRFVGGAEARSRKSTADIRRHVKPANHPITALTAALHTSIRQAPCGRYHPERDGKSLPAVLPVGRRAPLSWIKSRIAKERREMPMKASHGTTCIPRFEMKRITTRSLFGGRRLQRTWQRNFQAHAPRGNRPSPSYRWHLLAPLRARASWREDNRRVAMASKPDGRAPSLNARPRQSITAAIGRGIFKQTEPNIYSATMAVAKCRREKNNKTRTAFIFGIGCHGVACLWGSYKSVQGSREKQILSDVELGLLFEKSIGKRAG